MPPSSTVHGGQHDTHIRASASRRSLTKKLATTPSSTVHGGQHYTKYVTFELLLNAAFVAHETWGVVLEPARNINEIRYAVITQS